MPAAARTRVLRLLDDAVVTVSARVHASTMGQNVVELGGLTINRPASEVASALSAMSEVVFVVCTPGSWGLTIEVRSGTPQAALDVTASIGRVPGVVQVDLSTVLDYVKQDWSGLDLGGGVTVGAASRNPLPSPFTLDRVDRRVIGVLMGNGRATFADVAGETGLSPAAARNRVNRLLDARVVVIQTYVHPDVLGAGMYAGLSIAARSDVPGLAAQLARFTEATLVVITTGRYEIAGELRCRNAAHLLETMDRIRALPQVHRVECTPYLVIMKESFGLDLTSDESRRA